MTGAYPQILQEIFENNGAGPLFRGDKIPINEDTLEIDSEGRLNVIGGTSEETVSIVWDNILERPSTFPP